MTHKFEQPELKPGVYRHYKGDEYDLIAVACHSETHEWYVVYRARYDVTARGLPSTWVRPYHMFQEIVTYNGVTMPRFEHVRPSDVKS